jgi:hypothetical protein
MCWLSGLRCRNDSPGRGAQSTLAFFSLWSLMLRQQLFVVRSNGSRPRSTRLKLRSKSAAFADSILSSLKHICCRLDRLRRERTLEQERLDRLLTDVQRERADAQTRRDKDKERDSKSVRVSCGTMCAHGLCPSAESNSTERRGLVTNKRLRTRFASLRARAAAQPVLRRLCPICGARLPKSSALPTRNILSFLVRLCATRMR